jgi:endonuclease/exonuclease/phosphatase family metal-dependent hydrolase
MKEVSVGRHIAPAILTRLKAVRDRTRLLDKRQRTLVAHLEAHNQELIVIATHWTSRLGQDSDKRRAEYADKIYGAFRAMHKSNPKVDLLIAGDLNDTPDDPSLTQHLHAIGDAQKVLNPQNGPYLLNLFAGKKPDAGFGTHYYRKWLILDQIVVSPGLLDNEGWGCDPASVRTINTLYRPGDKLRRPWRFGSENDNQPRGYSDHFPVTVRLSVAGR